MAVADHRIVMRALVAGALVLTVGLSGCGRKAALDPPPSASVAGKETTAPKPEKPDRPFFLDWLL